MAHNVFISWSGEPSRRIAIILRDWLPTVIQVAKPFLSNLDIEAGARGLSVLSAELQTSQIGLICVTANNQYSPWLNFEAGCLAKTIDETYVIPLAFDIEKGQIKNPLGQFQAKQFTKDDVLATVETINKALGQALDEKLLGTAFGLSWPSLATQIEKLRSEHAQEPLMAPPKRTTEDMLEELGSVFKPGIVAT